MKLINYVLEEKLVSDDVEVFQNEKNGNLVLNLYNKFYYEESEKFITHYCHLLDKINFKSILIGGLGLGIIPYYLKNKGVTDVEVIEKDKNLIKIINQLEYLNDVKIYEDDAITFNTNKKYDLILMDLWWYPDSNFNNEKNSIIKNYENNLTDNGKIYFPIIDELI